MTENHRFLAALLTVLVLVISACNMPVAEPTTAPTDAPTDAPPTATPVQAASEAPEAGADLAVVGWYGIVTGLPADSQFDDYLFLLSEGAGSVGILGASEALEQQIAGLRAGAARAHFWGELRCDVADYNGCQVLAREARAENGGPSTPTAITGWAGKLYSTSQGAQFDDYFVLDGDFPIRYGVDSPAIALATYRDSGALVSVSGNVVCGVPDVNGCQIRVSTLEELVPGSSQAVSDQPAPASAPETAEDWVGRIVPSAPDAAYTYSFESWEARRRVGATSVDGIIQQQIVTLATTNSSARVHIWGTFYANDPTTANDDVVYISALQVEMPTPVPQQPTATPIVLTCSPAPRLQVGHAGRVAPGPLPNAVRSVPGTESGSTVLGNIPGGTVFTVLDGPVCANGYNWWRVNANGFIGWTAEGQASTYWLDPMTCGNGLAIRLVPGGQGRVTVTPPLPNTLRTQPNSSSAPVGEIPPGGVFNVLEGPQCGTGGKAYWRVNYNGLIGWTAEGDPGQYWLEPYTGDSYERVDDLLGTIKSVSASDPNASGDDYFELSSTSGGTARYGITSTDPSLALQIVNLRDTGTEVRVSGQLRSNMPDYNSMQLNVTQMTFSSPPPTCTLPTRLSAGYSARVTEGLPNAVHTAPGLSSSTVQANLPGGTPFRVIEGPRCMDGYNWWRITTGNITGWTAEGHDGEYWLEPLMCGNNLRSQLMPGMQARVAYDPPVSNTVRSAPGEAANAIGEIPPGGVFTVLAGPECATGGMTWWQVNYSGLVGWTAEGVPGQYWLEPIFN